MIATAPDDRPETVAATSSPSRLDGCLVCHLTRGAPKFALDAFENGGVHARGQPSATDDGATGADRVEPLKLVGWESAACDV